ncbi:hypothetical protein [Brevundimonas sp. R86498]|uniref:hypothetical protein n=1 Tax=Brevundimonas sp. R86498 TaxID=3093845 RepID=UPI0037C9D2CB
MTDEPMNDDDQPHFETSDVEANLAMEQGLGVGARELAAQRDAGGVVTPDEDEDEVETEDDADTLARNTSVLGEDPEA